MTRQKRGNIITPLCIVQTAPNLLHKITVMTWLDTYVKIDSWSQRHLLATGNDMFYTLMHCFWLLYNIELKLAQTSHKTFMVRIVTFPQTMYTLRCCGGWSFTKGDKVIITPLCIVQSAPKISPMIRVPAWTALYFNFKSGSPNHWKWSCSRSAQNAHEMEPLRLVPDRWLPRSRISPWVGKCLGPHIAGRSPSFIIIF